MQLNMQRLDQQQSVNSNVVFVPQYLKVLVRCMTSMLRNIQTIDRLVGQTGCRSLVALTKIMSFSRDEEITANSLKIVRYCIKDEKNQQKTIIEFPDMINQIIVDSFVHFQDSPFVSGEMKNILNCFTRKRDYVYLIKPDSIQVISQHKSGLIDSFPVLDSISKSYLTTQ